MFSMTYCKVLVKFLQKDIDKFKECQTNESTKDSFTEKKRKAWNRRKRTEMLVTITERPRSD